MINELIYLTIFLEGNFKLTSSSINKHPDSFIYLDNIVCLEKINVGHSKAKLQKEHDLSIIG